MSLYEDILAITREYMGVAAEDYIRRRIRIVSGGAAPESIVADRLDRLAVGIEMTAKGYMSAEKAELFRRRILGLKARHQPSE